MFSFLSNKESMPRTKVFFGTLSSKEDNGFIEIKGHGDSAHITFRDINKKEFEATIKVYQLAALKKTEDYHYAIEWSEVENLVHVWKTRRNKNSIIKYAEQEQTAFVFSAEDNLFEIYKAAFNNLYGIDYFKELRFCHFLQHKAKISIDELRNLPGMNEKRVIFLLENQSTLEVLFKHQMTIQQITALNDELFHFLLEKNSTIEKIQALGLNIDQLQTLDFNKVSTCLDHSWELEQALKVVTIEQILGLNHTPKPIPKEIANNADKWRLIGSFGGGVSNDFTHEHDDKIITIQHGASQTKFIATFGFLKDEARDSVGRLINKLETESVDLIHEWVIASHTNENKQKTNILYCPTLQYFQQEEIDANFPEEEFRKFHISPLLMTLYYQETMFSHFLTEQGYTIAGFKHLPGMSVEKLKLLSEHRYDLDFLLNAGIKMEDFAKVDLERLTYILENAHAAKHALAFVEARELLTIPGLKRSYAQTLFPAPNQLSDKDKEVESTNKCLLM